MTWIAIHTKPNQEGRAEENLERQGFAPFLPLVWNVGNLKLMMPLFPRYLFVCLGERQSWGAIMSTFGVSSVLANADGIPRRVPESAIIELQFRVKAGDGAVRLMPDRSEYLLKVGGKAKVKSGPWTGYTGLVSGTAVERTKLLLDILGGQREVSIPTRLLAPVEPDGAR